MTTTQTALVVGASRGLGLAVATELAARGWDVVGTVRSEHTPLHDLAASTPAVTTEHLDVTDPDQLGPLHDRLAERLGDRPLDLLLVTAGTTSHQDSPIGQVPTEAFVDVMVTNALGPVRAVEALQDLVAPDGTVAVMSSGQGSIANNAAGGRELYRGSKAALNMLLASLAARSDGSAAQRSYVLLAPGWIRTDLGGDDAPYTIEETVPAVVDVLLARRGVPGIAYLDRFGETVPW